MMIYCRRCGELDGDYSKSAISVSVKTGSIRVKVWLCLDCMCLADDAQRETENWESTTTTPPGSETQIFTNS